MDHDTGHSHPMNSFQPRNRELAQGFWYIIAGFLGFLAACRLVNFYVSQNRLVFLLCIRTL